MLSFLLKRFSGRHYRKFLEKSRPIVARINELESSYQALDRRAAPRQDRRVPRPHRRRPGQEGRPRRRPARRRSPPSKTPPAVCSGRKVIVCDHELTWDMVHFDVQLIGGMAIHEGKISEMATG